MNIKNQVLDAEEQSILDDFESGRLKPLAHQQEELSRIKKYLTEKHNKSKRVNIRLTEQDFLYAQSRALEDGLPYQTLLSSILHKYFTGKLVEMR
jgi:predicted DNA binding CopG/RHH family protein